ncbi:hypothetical protein HpBHB5_13920 [Helicobacter pylori]
MGVNSKKEFAHGKLKTKNKNGEKHYTLKFLFLGLITIFLKIFSFRGFLEV